MKLQSQCHSHNNTNWYPSSQKTVIFFHLQGISENDSMSGPRVVSGCFKRNKYKYRYLWASLVAQLVKNVA